MKQLLLLAALSVLAFSANADGYENINVNGKQRRMIVHKPADLPDNAPLVISFHGAYGTGEGMQKDTRWDAVSDTAKFVVVYPDGIDNWWDVYGNSDLQFVEKIIDVMADRYNIDRKRVYASGFSLGSMFTYHCAEHLANKIAAFGPVSGVRFDGRNPASTRRVPIIHTHGTNDDVFKWGGDLQHMAGGYPAISEYVRRWAAYDNLDPQPEVTNYRNCVRTVYSDENSTVEVQLLAVNGVGHWHSEGSDWGDISTSREIWEFVKKYSLEAEPEPAYLQSIEPENESFDLTSENRTFSLRFDRDVAAAKAQAVLSADGTEIKLPLNTDEDTDCLTFSVPEGTNIPDGYYTLTVSGIQNPLGGKVKKFNFNYTYGITEVGNVAMVDTVYYSDWDKHQATIGEGIPTGWKRTNSSSDGSSDSQTSGAANVAGSRLKYFLPGGEFNTGFYFCAREYDKCEFFYGNINSSSLSLSPGLYDLKFRSAYWNSGAEDAETTYDVFISLRANKNTKVLDLTGLKSSSCLNEKTDVQVYGSALHEYTFNVTEKNKYLLKYTISGGWNGVILGDICLTTHQPTADKYKGGLYRMLLEAAQVYAESAEKLGDDETRANLKSCMDKYNEFISQSPSAYVPVLAELSTAIKAVRDAMHSGINSAVYSDEPVSVEYFTADGRRVVSGYQGFAIERSIYGNGEVKSQKVIINK